MVEQVEEVEGESFLHASLNGAGEKVILRPGQYKVTRRGGEPKPIREILLQEVMPHIDRIARNHHYNVLMREEVLREVQGRVEKCLTELEGERAALDHQQEQSELHG